MYYNPWIVNENNWGYADGWHEPHPYYINSSPLIYRAPRFRRVLPGRFYKRRWFW